MVVIVSRGDKRLAASKLLTTQILSEVVELACFAYVSISFHAAASFFMRTCNRKLKIRSKISSI